MIKVIFRKYFKNTAALITAMVDNFSSPLESTKKLVNLYYKG